MMYLVQLKFLQFLRLSILFHSLMIIIEGHGYIFLELNLRFLVGLRNLLEKYTSRKIKVLRIDNGGELCSVEFCNVPILGHYNFTECYAYQSSQIGVTESSRDTEGFYWARIASFIIRIHSAQLGFGFVAF
jgi:hypothetical protein